MSSLYGPDHPSSERILFECVAGSRAYGTASADSDEDIRGIFALPRASYADLTAPPNQIADARNNIVYYSLRRTIELLTAANPSMLELLYMPADCVRRSSEEMNCLLARRTLFISSRCADAHIGYAFSQIKKARGQNKWINQPKPEQPPRKEDYCHVIRRDELLGANGTPCRPQRLAASSLDLTTCHAARLEHARDAYRLYHYGARARGVFRGDTLACEPIPGDDETTRFAGLLFYNEQAWKQALIDHQNYWTWRRERNEARWQQQESGELDFDAKNLMHTIRLLLSGKAILERGEPLVRVKGEVLQLLRDIRAGRYRYAEILEMADAIVADCERLKLHCDLPADIDAAAANSLLHELSQAWEQRR
ncbi:MAG: nucleotidyltransferase domain-containing protein [Rhodanobacteraceae bacterium]|nr:nucleotidyltransferase domain-containing protein [Rhodanobacteraceae bacterium]